MCVVLPISNLLSDVLQATNRGHCDCMDSTLYWRCEGVVKSFDSLSLCIYPLRCLLSFSRLVLFSISLSCPCVSLSYCTPVRPSISLLVSLLIIFPCTCSPFSSLPSHILLSLLLCSSSLMAQVHNKWGVYYCVL